MLIQSDHNDVVDDWSALMSLRSGPYGKRIIFDLDPRHQEVFRSLPYYVTAVSFDDSSPQIPHAS